MKDDVDVVNNGDGTHTARYTPSTDGLYQIQVRYDDTDVPDMPKRVRVLPTHEADKVKRLCTIHIQCDRRINYYGLVSMVSTNLH